MTGRAPPRGAPSCSDRPCCMCGGGGQFAGGRSSGSAFRRALGRLSPQYWGSHLPRFSLRASNRIHHPQIVLDAATLSSEILLSRVSSLVAQRSPEVLPISRPISSSFEGLHRHQDEGRRQLRPSFPRNSTQGMFWPSEVGVAISSSIP